MSVSAAYISEMCRAVRVSETETSTKEITELIEAAAADLSRQGVDTIDLDDPLTKQAVKLYCKAHYGYDNNTERFDAAYVSLSAAMSLCGDYDEDGDPNA